MARMLGAAGLAGSGCSPRCRRTHNPRPKHAVGAMRRRERAAWRREWDEDENAEWYARHGLAHLLTAPSA